MKTWFASSKRSSLNELKCQSAAIANLENVKDIFDTFPFLVAIVNENRQIVFSNNYLLDALGYSSMNELLGKRPGEMLNCIHSNKTKDGCGTTDFCSVCGVVHSILDCISKKEKNTGLCNIIANKEKNLSSFNLRITCSPIYCNDEFFVSIILEDVSKEFQRQTYERIFFHDIMNHVAALNGLSTLLRETTNNDKAKDYANIIHNLSSELSNEITSQKELILAENNELKLKIKSSNTLKHLNDITTYFTYHYISRDKKILIDTNSVNINFATDTTLLNRILSNMIKNALEFITNNEVVNFGCNHINNYIIEFWVQNPGFIKESSQMQIFQRSFSTKGTGRGMGTYSMKLLGEKYLNGIVGFTSTIENGTRFYIQISIDNLQGVS